MIQRDHPDLSISQQCKLVQLSRLAFYYTPVGVDADTLAVMKEIDRVFTKYPFFGSRQIAAYLRREDVVVGRHRVRRLMAKMGLEAIYKRPKTSQPHPQHPVYPYLLKKMHIDRLCCTNLVRDSSCESSMVAGMHEQTHTVGRRARCTC
ncbi:IS3 family transposase [Gymnodinialimonas ulvae]|uniref:IS3 family transposase n=1 Tax=Gymnodinialimonas ulvae TaxID=3126504 RepID=UPI0030A132FF